VEQPATSPALRTWTTNIGNGFIDYGARAMFERAFPDAEIVETGGYPTTHGHRGAVGGTRKLARMTGYDRGIRVADAPDPAEYGERQRTDRRRPGRLAWLRGLSTDLSEVLTTRPATRERGIPIVVIGGGGEGNDEDERKYVEAAFDALDIDVLLTRDRTAYEEYGDLVEYLYDGIDCSLFLATVTSRP